MTGRPPRICKNIKRASRRSAGAARDFNVVILATMSAGKSSLLNALIGRELLPTANEATTACLTSVAHRSSIHAFRGACHGRDGSELDTHLEAGVEQVRGWNADARIRRINLYGKFRTDTRLKRGLILHDTPGPNNSQDDKHAKIMRDVLRNVPFNVLCYVLNASQLGTNDDRDLLQQVRRTLICRSGYRVIFILNKVDLLDEERGEDLGTYVANARRYLEDIGFSDPIIVPTMASAALSAKKVLAREPLTRSERSRLGQHLQDFQNDNNPLLEAAHMPPAMKRRLARQMDKAAESWVAAPTHIDTQHDGTAVNATGLRRLVWQSGIGIVEFFLNQRSNSLQQ